MKVASIPAFILAFFCTANANASDCQKKHFNWLYGSDVSLNDIVKSGKICRHSFNARSGITSIQIFQKAEHGIVGVDGNYRWAYKSDDGYTGEDHYVITIKGEKFNGSHDYKGETNVKTTVNVVH